MRLPLFLAAGLCLVAAPDAAAQVPEVDLEVYSLEQTLDKVLDESVMLDAHLGPAGSCLRQEAAAEARDLYKDRAALFEDPVLDCLSAQCIGWPPEPFVSLANCERVVVETINDLLDVVDLTLHLQDT